MAHKSLKTLLSLSVITLFASSVCFSNKANALGGPSRSTPPQVDTIAEEVEKITSLELALAELDSTEKTISHYHSTLRQLGKGLFFDDPRETQVAMDQTQGKLNEQIRKASLLRAKIKKLEAPAQS